MREFQPAVKLPTFPVRARVSLLALAALALGCAPLPAGAPANTESPTPKLNASATPAGGGSTPSILTEASKTLIQSKKGRQWLMEASKVKWANSGQNAHVDKVDWTLKSPRGKDLVAVRAPGAEVFMDSSKVQFQGMVDTYRFSTGDHVWARDLCWDGKRGVLSGDHGVKWVRGTTTVTADHMTATDHLERIHLKGNVLITTQAKSGSSFLSGKPGKP